MANKKYPSYDFDGVVIEGWKGSMEYGGIVYWDKEGVLEDHHVAITPAWDKAGTVSVEVQSGYALGDDSPMDTVLCFELTVAKDVDGKFRYAHEIKTALELVEHWGILRQILSAKESLPALLGISKAIDKRIATSLSERTTEHA